MRLERCGVVGREAVNSEGHPGGFGARYPVLCSTDWLGADLGQLPRREAGATIVQRDGAPVLCVGRGGRNLRVLAAGADATALREAVAAFVSQRGLLREGPILVSRVSGEVATEAACRNLRVSAGFELHDTGSRLAPPL